MFKFEYRPLINMSKLVTSAMQDKENTPPGGSPHLLNLLEAFVDNLEERKLKFEHDVRNSQRYNVEAKIAHFMEEEMRKILVQRKVVQLVSYKSHVELDYSTYKAGKKIKQIQLIEATAPKKSVKISAGHGIIQTPLTLAKHSSFRQSEVKDVKVPSFNDFNNTSRWSVGIEISKEQTNSLGQNASSKDHELSQHLLPSIQVPQAQQGPTFWDIEKPQMSITSASKLSAYSGKKVSKIRDESELTPQKLFDDYHDSQFPKKQPDASKKQSPARSKSPILDKVKSFFSSGYNFLMGSRENTANKALTPGFQAKDASSNFNENLQANRQSQDGTGGKNSKFVAMLNMPAISERLSDRIARESKKPRISEWEMEQKLAEEFDKQGNMDNPHLAVQRINKSLQAKLSTQRDSRSYTTGEFLNKSMINVPNTDEDDEIKQKRGSLSRTPFKAIKSVSMEEDTDSKAFYACLNETGPSLHQVLQLARSESLPPQGSNSFYAEDQTQGMHSNLIQPETQGQQQVFDHGELNKDTQPVRTQEGSLGISREEDNSQFVPNTVVKGYFEAAQMHAQADERESSMGYELSDTEKEHSNPDHDVEEWREIDPFSDCKTYSQQKSSRMLLDEIKKHCGMGAHLGQPCELNPQDHRVKKAYSAMNLSEHQFMDLLERQKTPIKNTNSNKVLFVNEKRVPQWASDREFVRKTVLAQNAFGQYRAVFKKMKPLKEFNVAEFFPEIQTEILASYHR